MEDLNQFNQQREQNPMYEPQPPMPNNYLVWSILSTVLCCLPFGIVAIVYASKVNTLYISKQYEAANEASRNAKRWSIIAAVTGVVVGLAYICFVMFFGLAGALGDSL